MAEYIDAYDPGNKPKKIYGLVCPVSKLIIYVGESNNLSKRLYEHRKSRNYIGKYQRKLERHNLQILMVSLELYGFKDEEEAMFEVMKSQEILNIRRPMSQKELDKPFLRHQLFKKDPAKAMQLYGRVYQDDTTATSIK